MKLRVLFVSIFCLFILICLVIYRGHTQPVEPTTIPSKQGPSSVIGRIGAGYFEFDIADTEREWERGLSGTKMLPATKGMLFVFGAPYRQCFWMKDMTYSLDILWFDERKQLIYEKRNVSPDTYPENFCPDQPALYVVELTAGMADKNQIKLGDTLDVEL